MVTVLTTTFNCAAYIELAIKSILNQSLKDFEYLIIDDGSKDETPRIVKGFCDERIRYIWRVHKGRGAALNFGLSEAKYDLIALQDADDISHPKRLEKQILIKGESITNIIVSDIAYFKNNHITSINKCSTSSNSLKRRLILHGPFYHASMLYSRQLVLDYGGYNESIKANEDQDLFLKLLNRASVITIQEIAYFVRIRNKSLSNKPKITYKIQSYYINNLDLYLPNLNNIEKSRIQGLREFYYGDLALSRNKFCEISLKHWDFKILASYLLSYLNRKLVTYLIEKQIFLKIKNKVRMTTELKVLQSKFKHILERLNQNGC